MNKIILLSCCPSKSKGVNPVEKKLSGHRIMKGLLKSFIAFVMVIMTFISSSAQTAPSSAAPDPICDAGDVMSLFSNSYTDVPVDTWLTVWSAPPVTLTDLQISGNDTKFYEDVTFLGIETVGPNLIDASGMDYFNISFWSNNATQFRIKLVDFGADGQFGGGDDSEHEITFDNPAQDEWICYTIPLDDFTNLANREHIAQYILSAMPNGVADFYIDNMYFSNSNCIVAAPEPTCDPGNVISMFSNSYSDVPVDTWLTVWSAAPVTLTDLDICGNDLKLYEDVTFLGIETVGPNLIDASGMTHFNIDFWSGNATQFRIKLVDFGADMNFGGGDDTEHELTFANPPQNEWVSYQLPLSDFTNLLNTDHIAQLILSAMPNTVADFYIDNVYFSTCAPPIQPVDIEFCVDLNCFNQAPQVPSVAGTFTTPPWNFGQYFLSDPDNDGFWCTTVPLLPGNYEYKFFDQIEGQEDLTPGTLCTVTNSGFTNRFLTVVENMPETVSFGWESCDPECTPPLPPPDLPITFDDQGTVEYNFGNFGGMDSYIGPDPTNPGNMVMCSNKTPGAQCWAGTTVTNSGMQNPIPFSPSSMVMTMDVYSPNAGTPILLKVEGTGAPSEVLVFTTVANTWETLVFDFNNGFPAPPNLAASYDKVVVFAEFTCATTNAPGSGLTYYIDNIQMCELPLLGITCPDDISGLACDAPTPPAATDEASFIGLGGMIDNPCLNALTVTSVDTQSGDDCVGITITRTYTVTDGAETFTCDQIIAFDPPPPPVITCPADAVVDCIDNFVLDPNNATATSLCNNIVSIYIKNPLIVGAPGCNGTVYTYIYVAVDDCGKSSECEQQVLIQNTPASITPPVGGTIACYEDIDISVDDAMVENACAEYDLYLTTPELDGPINCPGTNYTYTYNLVDVCGNTITEDVVFTNADNEAPTIQAPADITADCLGAVNPNPNNAIVTTSCGDGVDYTVTVSADPTIMGPVDCPGTTYLYTYTVTDACGRTATDVQAVTVDNGPPVFIDCPEDNWLVLNCEDFGGEDGAIQVIEAWMASITAQSSCGVPLTVFNNFNANNVGTCINNGYMEVTFHATDACGRQSICESVVVINDTEAPEFTTMPQDHYEICNFSTNANLQAWANNYAGAEAWDGCSNENVNWTISPGNPTINCVGSGDPVAVTVTFIITDNCGNKTSETATFYALPPPELGGNNPGEFNGDNDGMSLFQNQPNPFKETTDIGFYLPVEMEATLTIYDVSGRVLKQIEGAYSKGYQTIDIQASELNTTGLIFYQLNTVYGSITKRMIVLD